MKIRQRTQLTMRLPAIDKYGHFFARLYMDRLNNNYYSLITQTNREWVVDAIWLELRNYDF